MIFYAVGWSQNRATVEELKDSLIEVQEDIIERYQQKLEDIEDALNREKKISSAMMISNVIVGGIVLVALAIVSYK